MQANTYFSGNLLLFTKKTLMENFIFGEVVFVNFIDHQFEQFVSRTFLGTTNVLSRIKNACFSKEYVALTFLFINVKFKQKRILLLGWFFNETKWSNLSIIGRESTEKGASLWEP